MGSRSKRIPFYISLNSLILLYITLSNGKFMLNEGSISSIRIMIGSSSKEEAHNEIASGIFSSVITMGIILIVSQTKSGLRRV